MVYIMYETDVSDLEEFRVLDTDDGAIDSGIPKEIIIDDVEAISNAKVINGVFRVTTIPETEISYETSDGKTLDYKKDGTKVVINVNGDEYTTTVSESSVLAGFNVSDDHNNVDFYFLDTDAEKARRISYSGK